MINNRANTMPYASRLEKIGLAVALIAIFIVAAHAEVITAEFEAGGAGVDASVTATIPPTLIGHRRLNDGHVRRDARQDAVVRNEEEFDRRFGMCRRC
jgi:hypothetical protein